MLAEQFIANDLNHAADFLEDRIYDLALLPVAMVGGKFIEKGGDILIKNADGTFGRVLSFVINNCGTITDTVELLNAASFLLKNNLTNDGLPQCGTGIFESPEESLVYHYGKHKEAVGATSITQYFNKAYSFKTNLKNAKKFTHNGVTRYVKNDKYIDLNSMKQIISFGKYDPQDYLGRH